jgi:hypothetical protein
MWAGAVVVIVSLLALLMSPGPVRAASCLEDAASFADRVCGEISNKGSSQLVSGSGALSAEARGLIARMLGSAQASGNVDAAVTSYENVTREELAKEHANVRDCREQMIIVAVRQVCPEASNPSAIPPSNRTEVLNKIAEFMEQGEQIRQIFIQKDDPTLIKAQYATWASNTHNYLHDIGPSFAAQFDNAHGGPMLPIGKSIEGGSVWAEIGAKNQVLSAMLGEIRRGD